MRGSRDHSGALGIRPIGVERVARSGFHESPAAAGPGRAVTQTSASGGSWIRRAPIPRRAARGIRVERIPWDDGAHRQPGAGLSCGRRGESSAQMLRDPAHNAGRAWPRSGGCSRAPRPSRPPIQTKVARTLLGIRSFKPPASGWLNSCDSAADICPQASASLPGLHQGRRLGSFCAAAPRPATRFSSTSWRSWLFGENPDRACGPAPAPRAAPVRPACAASRSSSWMRRWPDSRGDPDEEQRQNPVPRCSASSAPRARGRRPPATGSTPASPAPRSARVCITMRWLPAASEDGSRSRRATRPDESSTTGSGRSAHDRVLPCRRDRFQRDLGHRAEGGGNANDPNAVRQGRSR